MLKAIGRGHGVEQAKEACDLCREWGIMPHVDLIFGLPMESREDQLLTLELARWITARGGKVRAHLFTPLPGTPLAGTRPAPSMKWPQSWAGLPWRGSSLEAGGLQVEPLEGLTVLVLKLVFDNYLIRQDLDGPHRLREEEPDESTIGKLVLLLQAGGKLRGAEDISS